jgi:hypothetical protein
MGFHDFLESQRRPAQPVEPDFEPEVEENYEERAPQRRPRVEESSRYDSEDEKVLDEVDFYKQRLYKKIDSCFIRYGLAGLKKIDEGIAESLSRYISSLKGEIYYEDRHPMREHYTPNYRRPPERVRYRDDELDEGEEGLQRRQDPEPKPAPKPFKKPVKIEGSNPNPAPARIPGEPELQADVYNPELLNAILTDVIPPTEIHPVEIHSNIQVQHTTESSYSSDSIPDEVQESVQTSHYDIAADMLAGVENEEVDLIVPPTIEESSGEVAESVDELPTETVEFVDDASTDKQVEVKKRKKKR